MNIGNATYFGARTWGQKTALVDLGHLGQKSRKISYGELDIRVRQLAAHLQNMGLKVEDPVALIAENSIEMVVAWLGIVSAGCVVVPVTTAATPRELLFRIENTDCKVVLHDSKRTEVVATAVEGLAETPTTLELTDNLARDETPIPCPVERAPEDPAFIIYTSGTTGNPKGAVINHSCLFHILILNQHHFKLSEKDRVLAVLPLPLSYGSRTALLAPLLAGATVVIMPAFEQNRALSVLTRENITWMPAVPTMFTRMAALSSCPPLRALRWCLSAGGPLTAEATQRIQKFLGIKVLQAFGLTEASIMTVDSEEGSLPGSVGKPVWGIHIKVVDKHGEEVSSGTVGQVFVSGQNLMGGYLGETTSPFIQGYFPTGDLGFLDEEGRLTIVDRLNDMIVSGGRNIYSAEIENIALQLSSIQEVAVVGVPHEDLGEIPVMVVVPTPDSTPNADGLLTLLCANLAKFKIPRSVGFLSELPRAPSGKVLKRRIREMLEQEEIEMAPVALPRH